MRKIVNLILVFVVSVSFLPFSANAAITLVQTAQGGYGYVNNFSQPMGSNTTPGCMLTAEVTSGDTSSILSFLDTSLNTWNYITSDLNAGQRQTWLYYAYNIAGGADTINVTWGVGQFNDANIIVREYCGLTTTDPLDKSAHANDGGSSVTTHPTGTTAATTQANELVVAVSGSGAGSDPIYTAPSGYSNLTTQKGSDAFTFGTMADKIVSSTGTQGGSFTTVSSVVGQSMVATFIGSTSSPALPANTQERISGGSARISGGKAMVR